MKALKRPFLVRFTIGLASASLAFAAAAPVAGQVTAAPPLDGETLAASAGSNVADFGTIDITGDCDPETGEPTISYEATGPATGPYPGTYEESGTATLKEVVGAGNVSAVAVVRFEAQFTIDSPPEIPVGSVGWFHVMGTKELAILPPDQAAGTGKCAFGVESTAELHSFLLAATYEAIITTATGTCTTEGTASVSVEEVDSSALEADHDVFGESFLTGAIPLCVDICPPDEDEDGDEDGDGLIISLESQFATLLDHPDSDLDGIEDGNGDANGNGEDDEDEDDDECPDEDDDDEDDDDEDDDDEDDDDDDDD